jgi:Fur family ferric uptake transcriptional regulator
VNCRCHRHSKARAELPALTERLRKNSRKITGARESVLDILRRNAHPLTAKEIFQALPAGNCDLATVYRSLTLLQKTALVQRFDFGDGVARYELLAEEQGGHHHHLICTRCAHVVEIEECFPRELEKAIAARNGYSGITHKLEFFGLCPDCQRTS